MDFSKIIMLTGIICLTMSCEKKTDEMVSKTMYDQVVKEREEFRTNNQKALVDNEEKATLINSMVQEINSLSGRTFKLQSNVERQDVNQNLEMINELSKELKVLKAKLASTSDKGDRKLHEIIKNLQTTLLDREKEIGQLRIEIEEKNKQIKTLGNEVDGLASQLQQKNKELISQEKNSWLTMGDELLEAGDLLPEVKGHGNMKPIKRAKIEIYARAIECFERAEKLGEPSASRKKAEALNKYNKANSK